MERHIYDPNQPQGSMSLKNLRNVLRALFQGDLMPLRPRASLILDDMEYPSDAAAQEEWAGTGVTVSYSTTKQEGNYALQAVIDVTGDRTLARSKAMDISAFSQAKIWERCSDASSAIQFYIKDSSANESYWNITTNGTIDTWQQDTLDLTTPDSNNGTDADLSDVVEFGFRGLDASATYIFDTIKVLSGLAVAVDASNVGSFYKQVYLGKQPLEIGAKASPALTAPSANPRIDILTIDTSGALAWITGDEAASPVPKWASLTAGLMPICLVYCKVTMAMVVDYEDKDSNPNEAYIYADLRPLYGVGGQPVDETDTDTRKDKLVSNNLAKGWEAKEDAANKGAVNGYMGLDASQKGAQAPKDHSHTESEITDLDHDADKIKTKSVDAPAADDDTKFLQYDHGNSKFKLTAVDTTPPASSVGQGQLKTTTGEVSYASNDVDGPEHHRYTLPGGEYGFYPQTKVDPEYGDNDYTVVFQYNIDHVSTNTTEGSYTTRIDFEIVDQGGPNAGIRMYAQQRYITASGHDHWIFLLVNKTTKEIISAYQAPDHPSANQGGATELEIPHPFGSYDPAKHEIVVVDNAELPEMLGRKTRKKSLLGVIYDDYVIDNSKRPVWTPREIIQIDKYGDLPGKIIRRMKTPDWAKIVISAEEITLKRQMVEKLPDNILFKRMALKK